MKVGQLLSAGQDDSFDELVKGIPAIPLDEVMPSIEHSLGQPVDSVFESIQESDHVASNDRKKLDEVLLSTLFKSLFELGVVHGDPHMGNYYFRRDKNQQSEVVMMDFGCKIDIGETRRLTLLNLILAVSEDRGVIPIRNFAAMGFEVTKLANIGESLPMLSRTLFKPFLQSKEFHISHWELETAVDRLLSEKKWWFRSAGPSDLFLLMRAFQGVVEQSQMLRVSFALDGYFTAEC